MKSTLILLIGLVLAPGLAYGSAMEQRRPINLDVTDFEFERLAQNFAHMADAELEAPEDLLSKTVTLRLEGVRWQTALDAVCDSADCSWRLLNGHPKRLEITPGTDSKRGLAILSEKMNVFFSLQTSSEALEFFGSYTTLSIDIDPKVSGFITMGGRGLRVETALNIACEKLGCYWLVEGNELQVRKSEGLRGEWPAELGEPITMSLRDAEACEVLESLGRITKVSIPCPSFVQTTDVTVEAKGLPVDAILDSLADKWNATWHYEDDEILFTEVGEDLNAKLDLDLIDANACDVLNALAGMTGHTTTCSTFLQPKAISINVEQIEVRDLLDQLCEQWDCTWNVTNRALFVEARHD